jgi:hypothetical protein
MRTVIKTTRPSAQKLHDALRFCEAFEVLGGDRGAVLTAEALQAGRKALTARANARATYLPPLVAELQAAGVTSLRAIAAELNKLGIPTAGGRGEWQAVQVRRVLGRL